MSYPGGEHEREKKQPTRKTMAPVAHGDAACRCFSVTKRDDMKRMQMQTRYKNTICYPSMTVGVKNKKNNLYFCTHVRYCCHKIRFHRKPPCTPHREDMQAIRCGVVLMERMSELESKLMLEMNHLLIQSKLMISRTFTFVVVPLG